MAELILVTGGSRSGKSLWAEKLAKARKEKVAYVATGVPCDEEMEERIKRHKERRPKHWITIEEPYKLAWALKEAGKLTQVVLVDCLSLWVANILLEKTSLENMEGGLYSCDLSGIEEDILKETDEVIDTAVKLPAQVIFVTNEVGWGIVPEYPLGRSYRDILGRVNQRVAVYADEVYLVVAGIPVELKSIGVLENGKKAYEN